MVTELKNLDQVSRKEMDEVLKQIKSMSTTIVELWNWCGDLESKLDQSEIKDNTLQRDLETIKNRLLPMGLNLESNR